MYMADIGIGAAGSEVVIINNLSYTTKGLNYANAASIFIPVNIPKGTRVAVRAQSSTGNKESQLSFGFGSSGFAQPSSLGIIDTYGATTATTRGISIDPGGTAWTYGAYIELASAITRPAKGIFIATSGQNNSVRTLYQWRLDVGIGGAGAETSIISELGMGCATGDSDIFPWVTPYIPIRIPAGTRVALKAVCSGNDATDRLFDAVLYTVS